MATGRARLVPAVAALVVWSVVLTAPAAASVEPLIPPDAFRAVYLTYWSAATPSRVEGVMEMAREGLINSVVIDLKDVTGHVAFDTRVAMAEKIGAERVIIQDVSKLVAKLQGEGLYVIGRVVVFTDPKLAEARPELGVHSEASVEEHAEGLGAETLWRDRRKLAWIDPAAVEAWDYNIAIARDAAERGFDEINFDYIRFPSDGNLRDMHFPIWDGSVTRRAAIRDFFRYLRQRMGPAVISADLFGLATVNRDDLGIGQVLEDALPYFDYVCPMVYPSHYAAGFIGKENPAEHPYEVVHYSMKKAGERRQALGAEGVARLRPWLQDFDMGAEYTAEMVREQIRATLDALGAEYTGFVMWNPRNVYTRDGLGGEGGEPRAKAGEHRRGAARLLPPG